MIILDIETLPTQDEELINRLCADLRPPANYKNDDAIEKWMVEARKKVIADTALNGAYGMIACICASNKIDVTCVSHTKDNFTEKEAISSFFDSFDFNYHHICGHNIAAFDLPFLKHRAIVNGIKPPKGLLDAMNAKPWDDCIKDTMLMWSKTKMISLDTLAWILGIENKNTFDGSQVAEMWSKDPNLVIQKCINDVSVTRQVYNRLTFNGAVF